MDAGDGVIISASVCLLASCLVLTVAVLRRRPVFLGLLYAVAALVGYIAYFGDRIPGYLQRYDRAFPVPATASEAVESRFRWLLLPLGHVGPQNANLEFSSALAPALIVAGLYVFRMIAYWRLLRGLDVDEARGLLGVFLAGVALIVVAGAILAGVYSLGGVGIAVYAIVATMIFAFLTTGLELAGLIWDITLVTARKLARGVARLLDEMVLLVIRLAAFFTRFGPDLEALRRQMEEREREREKKAQKDRETLRERVARIGSYRKK